MGLKKAYDELEIADGPLELNQNDITNVGAIDSESVSTDDHSVTNVGVQAYLSSDQSISSSAVTKVQLDAVSNDDESEFDSTNNSVVVKDSGKYLIAGSVKWEFDSGWSNGDQARPLLNLNGSTIADLHTLKVGISRQSAHVPPVKRNLSSADEITLNVYQDSGTSQILRGTERESFLSVTQVG